MTPNSNPNKSRFTHLKKESEISVDSLAIFESYEHNIKESDKISELLSNFTELANNSAKENFGKAPTSSALNNCKGRWFELVFFKAFSDLLDNNSKNSNRISEIFKLPSSGNGRKFFDLFDPNVTKTIERFNASNSNPDFVILSNLQKSLYPSNSSLLNRYQYTEYFGKVSLDQLNSILSIKTSARPDRRYQPVYESNMIKALLEKLGISVKFIVISTEENAANEKVYASPSIKSILCDDEELIPSIDKSFVVKRVSDIRNVFNYIFNIE